MEEYKIWEKQWANENPTREVNSWMETFKKTGNPIHRVYPSRLAIKSNPAIKKEDLLWHEDIEQIFQRAEIIIAGPCGCRSGRGMAEPTQLDNNLKSTRCNHPMWNCFQFSKAVLDEARKRGGDMMVYSYDEAIAKLDEAERAGLIHEGPGNAAVMPGVYLPVRFRLLQHVDPEPGFRRRHARALYPQPLSGNHRPGEVHRLPDLC